MYHLVALDLFLSVWGAPLAKLGTGCENEEHEVRGYGTDGGFDLWLDLFGATVRNRFDMNHSFSAGLSNLATKPFLVYSALF